MAFQSNHTPRPPQFDMMRAIDANAEPAPRLPNETDTHGTQHMSKGRSKPAVKPAGRKY